VFFLNKIIKSNNTLKTERIIKILNSIYIKKIKYIILFFLNNYLLFWFHEYKLFILKKRIIKYLNLICIENIYIYILNNFKKQLTAF